MPLCTFQLQLSSELIKPHEQLLLHYVEQKNCPGSTLSFIREVKIKILPHKSKLRRVWCLTDPALLRSIGLES